jgi:hypothetical protein
MICEEFTEQDLLRALRSFFRDADKPIPEDCEKFAAEFFRKHGAYSYELFVVERAKVISCKYTGLLDNCKRSLQGYVTEADTNLARYIAQ